MAAKTAISLLLLLACYHLSKSAEVPPSPCRNMFIYKVHSKYNHTYGYIRLTNLKAGEDIKLDVVISVGALLKKEQKSLLKPSKSIEATYKEIVTNRTARYWIKFPLQDPLPWLVSITRNGEQICSGPRAKGSPVTTINMSYTIFAPKSSSPSVTGPNLPVNYDMYPNLPITRTTTVKPATTSTLTPADQQDICGTTSLVTRLSINGISTSVGQFPWVVPLFKRQSGEDPEYFCTGTILTRRHLLTAAHCVYDKRAEDVVAIPGMHDISDFSDRNGAFADVQEIISHEDFDMDSEHLVDQDADIAMLRLWNLLQFTQNIRPLCLWRNQASLNRNTKHRGVVSGWGETEDGKTNLPFYYTSTVVSRQKCSDTLGFDIPRRARLICADGAGSVACKGDSGSALAMSRNNRFYLRGVVSKTVLDDETLTCAADKYAIFTDAAKFMDWIVGNIQDEEDD